ncbi:hypothetical protein BDY21DRAFT_420854 [Lineolata rhizophorae]|uniref:Glycosyl transferase n=1 Tax=Lineolata rhizophorae TaxID=578093 RepID=A0A6A6P405_9PEZI|nr:hypothetical protein BDY21DRAFT_420854 [Lineolata rhizophorae]
MADVDIVGFDAVDPNHALENWWQKALLGIIVASAAVGILTFLWAGVRYLWRKHKESRSRVPIPNRVKHRLDEVARTALPYSHVETTQQPKTFGVYLGRFSNPPTQAQGRLLERWDSIILDLFQPGVLNVVQNLAYNSPCRVIARLDVGRLPGVGDQDKATQMCAIVDSSIELMKSIWSGTEKPLVPPAILIAGWDECIPGQFLNNYADALGRLGLEVFLEVSAPNFLDGASVHLKHFSGVVLRNATILSDGEMRDYFQMEKMKSTVKSFVTQSTLRPFTVMMWEMVDDNVELSHAVIRRSFSWTSYHGGVPFIGTASSLLDAASSTTVMEPLGAFQWLKEGKIMKVHEKYREANKLCFRSSAGYEVFRSLELILPSLKHFMTNMKSWNSPEDNDNRSSVTTLAHNSGSALDTPYGSGDGSSVLSDDHSNLDWATRLQRTRANPLSASPNGTCYDGFGCFPIGLDATLEDFNKIVKSQVRLRRLNLLSQVPSEQLREYGRTLQEFVANNINAYWPFAPLKGMQAIQTLAELLVQTPDNPDQGDIQVFIGLDSGFHTAGLTQFWAVFDHEPRTGSLILYTSKSSPDLLSTIIHTYLSSEQVPRYHCFWAEAAFAQFHTGIKVDDKLPHRIENDLKRLSPTELLAFLQHIRFSDNDEGCPLLNSLWMFAEELLLEIPTFKQLKKLGTYDYLAGHISDLQLVEARLEWYRQHGHTFVSTEVALHIFREVDNVFRDILLRQRYHCLDRISNALQILAEADGYDPAGDFLTLAVFCAARKYAFDEIYVEVSDRNPLQNEYSDQSGAMAELFALGARCDAYFDITPNVFGKLLAERHRSYYGLRENQPPMWIDNAPAFASAYAAAQTDIDPNQKPTVVPGYRRFTYLSVFAIPALIDIILLTTTGRGLYLSAFMTKSEQENATLALMISLLLSGAIGTWISIGGTYYLISMAFSAANMFVLTRLIGGLAFTLFGGLIGFIVISAVEKVQSGLIFFFYLFGLTSYLSVLAALSSFQAPGSSFLSGRKIIIMLIPILGISPILTLFIDGADSIIYLTVLFIFVLGLVLGTRYSGSQWVMWCNNITTVDDKGVKDWYVQQVAKGSKDAFAGLTDPAAISLSRGHLYEAVMKEKQRPFWRKSTADPLVKNLAKTWDATIFLLDWYCRTTDVRRPIPFSSTWNIEVRVAHDSLRQNQKGIRIHNAFIHWRNAGEEIGCGVLYFVVALLDRWVELCTGGSLVGLSAVNNQTYRMSVGFSLAYYLIGAVLLDYKAQHLHQLSSLSRPVTVMTAQDLQAAKAYDARFRQKLYWKTLFRFLGVHVWALSVTATLIFLLDGTLNSLIMFLSYVGAYTGLLWYQYNKIFSGERALVPLLVATVVGFPLGVVLKLELPSFTWNMVIPLATATWIAAILTLRTARIGLPKFIKPHKAAVLKTFHAYGPGSTEHQWSQAELEAFYDALQSDTKGDELNISPEQHPGVEVRAILMASNHHTLSPLALKAFPQAPEMIHSIIDAWRNGLVSIDLVNLSPTIKPEAGIRAISCLCEGHLHIYIASDPEPTNFRTSISNHCRSMAEIVLHACAEAMFDIQHEHASLFETLLVAKEINEDDYEVPESIKRMGTSKTPIAELAISARHELVRFLCLGIDPETKWETLPQEVRSAFLHRCVGGHASFAPYEFRWLDSQIGSEMGCNLQSRIARYDLGALMAVQKWNYLNSPHGNRLSQALLEPISSKVAAYERPGVKVEEKSWIKVQLERVAKPFAAAYRKLGVSIKFIVLALVADPEYQRELDYMANGKQLLVPLRYLLNLVWRYCHGAQTICFSFFLLHGRNDIQTLWKSIKGTRLTLDRDRMRIESLDGQSTAFIHRHTDGGFELVYYPGVHKTEPTDRMQIKTVCIYDKALRLLDREEYDKGELVNKFMYDYPSDKMRRHTKINKIMNPRLPMTRNCVRGKDAKAIVHYDFKGRIGSGSYYLHGNLVRFKYHYRKNTTFDDGLLRAEFSLPHMTVNVSWCASPIRHPEKLERWIPHNRVVEATFVQGPDVYECNWNYDHKFHPRITTRLNGIPTETPDLIGHDWLGVLKKPTHTLYRNDNPLLEFRSANIGIFSRLFGLNTKLLPVSTSTSRSQLWKAWKKRNDLDGVVIRWLDEQLMRAEPILKQYWKRRDRGSLSRAEDHLALHADAVMASAELSSDISAWTPLAIRMSDLFSFGQGGDAVVYTRSKSLQPDTDQTLHVVAVDTGTWPNEGGGVSACRRDVINNLHTIRWHMIVESATDFGLPKYQTEENVESLKIVPLWGLDFMQPVHGWFSNKLDSEIDQMTLDATIMDIKRNFIPTLTALVKGARAIELSPQNVKEATRALVNLNTFFENSRHWMAVWTSDIVKDTWRRLWLEDMPGCKPASEWFDCEHPTIGHFDTALDLWFRYLFIFSIPIPERIPAVFQASHHSTSAAYGIVCKIKRGSTLAIWDHAISWRETNLYLSSAMCTLPPFMRNSLLGLLRLTSMLTLYHADQILPCADFFNPGWETEIGTAQGTIEHRNTFRRKIDPIVNGIEDMKKFAPVKEIQSKKPTVTMLSHLWFAKDIKTALLAADIIVNEWGFSEYNLDVYGALNKSPIYSSECQEIVACKGIGSNVTLKGTADPGMVLANTWVFLNSSVSEGLPLALGEAALTGAPVVCTDVGASLSILTDRDTGARYSSVVAPNDPRSIARAQIEMLAMIGEWAPYAEDEPGRPAPTLPVNPTPQDVAIITQRMYDKTEQRRKLGLMAREIVQKAFSGERYLREHEQMLWIGKAHYEMRAGSTPGANDMPVRSSGFQKAPAYLTGDYTDDQLQKMAHPRPTWLKHSSHATSFSSMWDDPGISGLIRGAPGARGSGHISTFDSTPASSRRGSYDGYEMVNLDGDDPKGTTPKAFTRPGVSGGSTPYRPSSLREVRNMEDDYYYRNNYANHVV